MPGRAMPGRAMPGRAMPGRAMPGRAGPRLASALPCRPVPVRACASRILPVYSTCLVYSLVYRVRQAQSRGLTMLATVHIIVD